MKICQGKGLTQFEFLETLLEEGLFDGETYWTDIMPDIQMNGKYSMFSFIYDSYMIIGMAYFLFDWPQDSDRFDFLSIVFYDNSELVAFDKQLLDGVDYKCSCRERLYDMFIEAGSLDELKLILSI